MRTLSPEHQIIVDFVLASENPKALITYELVLGDESFIIQNEEESAGVIEGSWGSSDGPALELDVEFAGLLPEELDGAEVQLIAYVRSIPVVQFSGKAELTFKRVNTDLEAFTSWQYVEDYTLQDGLEISDRDAATLAYELISKAPYRARITVEEVDIEVNQEADRAVPELSSLADALEIIHEGAEIVYRDTAVDGHRAGPKTDLAVPGEPVFVFEPVRHYDPVDGISVKKEPAKFGKVLAYRQSEDGGIEVLAEQVIDEDLTGFIDHIEIGDEARPFEVAKRKVAERSIHHRRGKYEISLDTLFAHPTIERDDWGVVVQEVDERRRGDRYRITKRYHGFIKDHQGNLPEKNGKVTIEAFKQSEELRVIEEVQPEYSEAVRPLIGLNSAGKPFISTALPWASRDGNYIKINTVAAAKDGVNFYETDRPNIVRMVR